MASQNDQICAEFECQVCFQYMHPPIRQCAVGHTMCDSCFRRVDKCPMCRSPLWDSRCLALERIHGLVLFPCVNANNGCEEKLLGDAIVAHQKRCPAGFVLCPMRERESCTWIGHRNDIFVHCVSTHGRELVSCEDGLMWLMDPFKVENIPEVSESYHLVKQGDKLFVSAWRFFRTPELLCHTMFYVGTKERAKSYICELSVCLQIDGGCSYTEIISPCKSVEDFYVKDCWKNSVPIRYEMVKDYFTSKGLAYFIDVNLSA